MAGWRLQHQKRKKGRYWQVVWGRGKGATSITLGYLTDEAVALARERIRSLAGPHLLGRSVQDDIEFQVEQDEHSTTNAAGSGVGTTNATEDVEALVRDHGDPVADTEPHKDVMRAQALHFLTRKPLMVALEEVAREEATLKVARGELGDLTLAEFCDQVWDATRRRQIAESSYRSEKRLWPTIRKGVGGIKLPDLTTAVWVGFLDSQATWGGRTKALAQNAYRCALSHAKQLGAIESVHEFPAIKGARTRTRERPVPFTLEEAVAVAANATTAMHKALFGYAIWQGLRPGEANILQWEDVDWRAKTVHVRGSKTASADAVVPLMPDAERYLRAWWEDCHKPKKGPAFVWNGKPFTSRTSWRTAWKKAAEKAGIDMEKRRVFPYLARHSFANLALAAGVNDAAIRGMMRHTHRSTILEEAYENQNSSQLRDAMTALTKSTTKVGKGRKRRKSKRRKKRG